jgi:citrate synthase
MHPRAKCQYIDGHYRLTGANPMLVPPGGIWGRRTAAPTAVQDAKRTGSVNVAKCVEKAKDRTNPFRLMGFGHRVYKNYDPRASIIRAACHDVLAEMGRHDPLMDLALELERTALEDPYFIEKKLYPNVDFYSGIIYRALGFPVSMFTVMFAIARTVGWVAQWLEQSETPTKIGRPRQVYNGPLEREYIPISKRG